MTGQQLTHSLPLDEQIARGCPSELVREFTRKALSRQVMTTWYPQFLRPLDHHRILRVLLRFER